MSSEGKANLKAMISFKGSKDWAGLNVVPAGSMLEDILELFRDQTDIPLELPLAATLSHVSGYLNAVGAKYELGGSLQAPKLWIVALAASGSGKTYATDKVSKWLTDASGSSVVPALLSASSAAKFAANINATPHGLMVRDEFGQFLNQIQTLSHMEEIKDILLQAFSGASIIRMTKETQICITDHAFSILGITVAETFESQIGADSLVDGFAQRFNYILADRDPERALEDYPIYFEDWNEPYIQDRYNRIRSEWSKITTNPDYENTNFTFTGDALNFFKVSFKSLFNAAQIPGSFYRRAMFSVFSYAVIFHVTAGKSGSQVERDSVGLAVRMVALHLDNARRLLEGYGLSDLEKTIRKAEDLRDKRASQGIDLTPRDMISSIREIKTAGQAKAILSLIVEPKANDQRN